MRQTNGALHQKKNQVVVIGAGFAGLVAAYRLYQAGYKDIEIYEARGRVGGRVLSARIMNPTEETIVELGGQNIPDGGDAPTFKALTKELGLSLLEDEIEIKQAFYNHETKSYVDILSLQQELFPLKNQALLKSKIQTLSAQAKNMEEVLLALFPDKGLIYRSLVLKFAAYEGGIPSQVSAEAWYNLYYMLCGGLAAVHATNKIQRASIKGGNAQFALELAQKLKGHIHLSLPLKAMSRADNNRILLNFEGGKQKECDKVILTIPCSVYKNIQVEPKVIPKERLAFIHKVPYGSNAKILLPLKFGTGAPNSVMTDDMAAFFSQDNDIIILYFSGTAGHTLKRRIKEKYAHALGALKAIDPSLIYPSTPLPQVVNDEAQLSIYNGAVTHFWVDDPYARGSYSYRSPEIMKDVLCIQDYKGEKVRAPYSPLQDHVFFAGEHTAVDADFGTLEGAVESGERAAKMILASSC